MVLTDLGAFVLINVYVPNAGDRSGDGERTAFKIRFLEALKEKADALRAAGRQVLPFFQHHFWKDHDNGDTQPALCASLGWTLIPRRAGSCNGLCFCCQVIIVGDLNVAASQKDVHSKLKYDWMYSAKEKALLQSLLNDYTDAWRLKHPEEQATFTVWDEKTSARAFNEVR